MTNFFKRSVLLMLISICGAFSALVYAGVNPEFSNGTTDKWYLIKFTGCDLYLTGHGLQEKMTVERNEHSEHQYWKLEQASVASRSFYLKNKAGYYAVLSRGRWNPDRNDKPLLGSSEKGGGYTLNSTTMGTEIATLDENDGYLNTWGITAEGTEIGVWKQSGDRNNDVEFILVDADQLVVEGIANYQPKEKNTLWYTKQGKDTKSSNPWMEYSLPIGNGQLGASIFGDIKKDEILFNEKTLWTGDSKSVGTDANGNEYGAYQCFGSIFIEDQNELSKVTNYLRDLNLATATASMSYSCDNVDYKREYIVSNPHNVIATRLTTTQPGGINIKVSLAPKMSKGYSAVEYNEGEAHFSGKLDVVSFDARMKVVADGHTVSTLTDGIKVTGATEVVILLAAGTDYDITQPDFVSKVTSLPTKIKDYVDAASALSWDDLYGAHVTDYKRFFDRVKFDLSGSENKQPTNLLVDNYRGTGTAADLMLEELYFNYGRYLEIASSRGIALPSNLQGIWNNDNKAAWNSDIHANINVQMNYWPAEITNMREMHEPFLNYIIEMADSEPWTRYAKEAQKQLNNGSARGWTCYTENNIFGGVGVWAHNYVIVNAWYCTHLWQHYCYTLDDAFLAKAFPVMLSAAQFWLDRLILVDGQYLCPNEYSPEHGRNENGVAHAQQLVWELFDNTLKAIQILGTERCGISKGDLDKLNDCYVHLDKGLGIERYGGIWGTINGVRSGTPILREWKYSNYDAGQSQHRHMSHLMCLYPFSQVAPGSEYFTAAVNSLKLRGDLSTGWSMGWKINLWARALDGNHAHTILKSALRHSTSYGTEESKGGIYYNLYDSHAPFQIDGNFGACAGIAEMLFQSHNGVLHFLPALPDVWANGHMDGLKGVGNFTVGFSWENNELQRISIVNNKGKQCLVQCSNSKRPLDQIYVAVNDIPTEPVLKKSGVYEIPSGEGDRIEIDFSRNAGGGVRPDPAYKGVCGEQLTWILDKDSKVLTIEGTGQMTDYSLSLPAPWDGVVDEIASVVLPEGLTTVGSYAFFHCNNISEITFTDNDIKFGHHAFAADTKTKLIITDSDYASGDRDFPLNGNIYSEITYVRNMQDNKWGTVVLPFVLDEFSSNEYHFYQMASIKDNALVFQLVDSPQAHTPYMYKNVEGQNCQTMVSNTEVQLNAKPIDVRQGQWRMLGTYENLSFSETNGLSTLYVMSGGKIVNSKNRLDIRPFRAYFEGPAFDKLGVKSMRIVIDDNGEMMDITETLLDTADKSWVIYDLAGRRVWKTIPGHIYIQNGEKYIAK